MIAGNYAKQEFRSRTARHSMALHRQLLYMGLSFAESANFICSYIAATQMGWEPPGPGISLNVLAHEMTDYNADQVYLEYGFLTPSFMSVAETLSTVTQKDPVPVYMCRTLENVALETRAWQGEEIKDFLQLIMEESYGEK